MIFTDIIAQNGYIGQYIRFVYYFFPMYNVSTLVVIWTYWGIIVPRASGRLDIIPQYVQITTDVLYQYSILAILLYLFDTYCFLGEWNLYIDQNPLQTSSIILNQPQDHTKSKFQVQSFFDNLEKQSFETVTKISMFWKLRDLI